MKTTNIYYIVDSSYCVLGKAIKDIRQNLIKVHRALSFLPIKTKLHLIAFNDKGYIISPFDKGKPRGNPDLNEGLKMLETIMLYGNKYPTSKARSIFILHSSGKVLYGWEKTLERLYRKKEFAFGLRYVVTHGIPDKEAKKAFERFTESPDRILPYFSEGRLCSLIRSMSQ